jgi:hypothetical protein
MARTIAEIEQSIITSMQSDSVLSAHLTSTSKVALFRLVARIAATASWTVEVLFDTLKIEINEIIAKLKPHTLRWYATKALAFQYGYNLPLDSDVYDNSLLTEEEIDESKIIKYVAVTEGNDKRLRIKVVTETDGALAPIEAGPLAAFAEYMALIKDAGVKLQIDSLDADKLKLSVKIFYNPLILNADGERLDGSDSQPIQKAIDTFLKNQPFNGVFVLAFLVDALQKVDGVVIPHIVDCQTAYGALPFTSVNVQYLPDAGYLRFEDPSDLTLEFVPQTQLQ